MFLQVYKHFLGIFVRRGQYWQIRHSPWNRVFERVQLFEKFFLSYISHPLIFIQYKITEIEIYQMHAHKFNYRC